ncbi:MAG TPA: hypothetical protein VKT53_09910 [Candidatus Acidoferrum sp.]|nr:hypothetical protein [Candidatus Acidoferrum sp.]
MTGVRMRAMIRAVRFLSPIFITLLAAVLTLADSKPSEELSSKAFEGAVTLAQTLTQWTLLIFGGSVALLVGSSHRRPGGWIKYAYFLFLPGWLFLGLSLYWGRSVQGVYLALLLQINQNITQLKQALNSDSYKQMRALEFGLGVFGVWLLVYLFWWILTDPKEGEDP